MPKTILLTGFGLWGEEKKNTSWELLCDWQLELPEGWQAAIHQLPVSWRDAPQLLEDLLETIQPSAVVCFGMGRSNAFEIEKIAINLNDPELKDNAGMFADSEHVIPKAAPAYYTGLPSKEIRNALIEKKIPCAYSRSAGGYLCNHVFYRLMWSLDQRRRSIPAGFIHVPRYENLESIEHEVCLRALSLIVSTVVESVDSKAVGANPSVHMV